MATKLKLSTYFKNKSIKLSSKYRVYLKMACLGVKQSEEIELYFCEDIDIPKLKFKSDEYILGNIGIKIPYLDNESALSVKLQLVDDKSSSIEKLIMHRFYSRFI